MPAFCRSTIRRLPLVSSRALRPPATRVPTLRGVASPCRYGQALVASVVRRQHADVVSDGVGAAKPPAARAGNPVGDGSTGCCGPFAVHSPVPCRGVAPPLYSFECPRTMRHPVAPRPWRSPGWGVGLVRESVVPVGNGGIAPDPAPELLLVITRCVRPPSESRRCLFAT